MAKGIEQNFKKAIFDLEPTALLEFYTLFYDYQNDRSKVLFFHGSTNNKISEPIIYAGQEYLPISVEASGFEVLGDQKLPRPTIKFGNFGLFFSSMLRKHNNLSNAKLVRVRTFAKFLDDVNFPNNTNPFNSANPDAKIENESYFINRKISENKAFVEFELVSSLELENINVPNRTINARYCSWVYRGFGCRYGYNSEVTGDGFNRPVATIKDDLFVVQSGQNYILNPEVFDQTKEAIGVSCASGETDGVMVDKGFWQTGQTYQAGDYIYLRDDAVDKAQDLGNNVYKQINAFYICRTPHSSDESKRPNLNKDLWAEDVCSKSIHACKLRYSNSEYADAINRTFEIRFGGFPGTEEFSYN